jgi:putative ABC transport system ATP-binding protein
VLFRGSDLAGLDPLGLRRKVGMVFQRPTLFAGTVRDNLRVAREANDAEYADALERVGLPRRHLDDQGDTLSGGEAQRACLARTLLTGPEVLLMDEPTSSLDPAAARLLEDLTADLVRGGLTVLWVSHDLAQARRIADEMVVLVDGRIAAEEAAAAYLGL